MQNVGFFFLLLHCKINNHLNNVCIFMKKNTSVVISDQLLSLDKNKRALIRDQFCSRSGILITSFYKKMKSNRWSLLEIELLNNLLAKISEDETAICKD